MAPVAPGALRLALLLLLPLAPAGAVRSRRSGRVRVLPGSPRLRFPATLEAAAAQAGHAASLAHLAGYPRIRLDVSIEALRRHRPQLRWVIQTMREFARSSPSLRQGVLFFRDASALNHAALLLADDGINTVPDRTASLPGPPPLRLRLDELKHGCLEPEDGLAVFFSPLEPDGGLPASARRHFAAPAAGMEDDAIALVSAAEAEAGVMERLQALCFRATKRGTPILMINPSLDVPTRESQSRGPMLMSDFLCAYAATDAPFIGAQTERLGMVRRIDPPALHVFSINTRGSSRVLYSEAELRGERPGLRAKLFDFVERYEAAHPGASRGRGGAARKDAGRGPTAKLADEEGDGAGDRAERRS